MSKHYGVFLQWHSRVRIQVLMSVRWVLCICTCTIQCACTCTCTCMYVYTCYTRGELTVTVQTLPQSSKDSSQVHKATPITRPYFDLAKMSCTLYSTKGRLQASILQLDTLSGTCVRYDTR